MKPMTPISCTRQAMTTFSSMPALTACRALCSKWLAGPNRYLKKSIRVGRVGIFGRRGSSPISMCLPGFWASNAPPFAVLISPSASLNRRDLTMIASSSLIILCSSASARSANVIVSFIRVSFVIYRREMRHSSKPWVSRASPAAGAPRVERQIYSGALRLSAASSNPGRHLVIAVGDVIFGNVVGGGVPNAVVAENVPKSLVEMLRRIRTPDIVRMKRKTHHAPVFRTFPIERVELIFDHLQEVIRLTIPAQHARIIGLAGIGNVDELLAAAYVDRPGLIIDDP